MPPPKFNKQAHIKKAEVDLSFNTKLHKAVRPAEQVIPPPPLSDTSPSAEHLEFVLMEKGKRDSVLGEKRIDKTQPLAKRVPMVAAHQRMADLNFDPLAMSVAIAKGEALQQDHPFLAELTVMILKLIGKHEKDKKVDWEEELHLILEKARKELSNCHVPIHLRSDHVKELMGYLYPKLKATEHSGTIQHALRVKPLSADEVKTFKLAFDEDY